LCSQNTYAADNKCPREKCKEHSAASKVALAATSEATKDVQEHFKQLDEQEEKWKTAVHDQLEKEEIELAQARSMGQTAASVAVVMGVVVVLLVAGMIFCYMKNQSTIRNKVKEAVSEFEKRQQTKRHKYAAAPGTRIEMGGLMNTARHEQLEDELDCNGIADGVAIHNGTRHRPLDSRNLNDRLDNLDDLDDIPSTSI
jgi:hypothetical protein